MPKVRLRGGRYPQAFVGKNLRTNVERSGPQKGLDGGCGITGLAEEEDTMIHHLSIAARDPKHAAEVLAEIMGG